MSIASAWNPMGTLGAVARKPSGYVEDGLVFWLDCLAEGDGTHTALTDFVSGRKIACGTVNVLRGVTQKDGGTLRISIADSQLQKSLDFAIDLVAGATDKRLSIGLAGTIFRPYTGDFYPTLGIEKDGRVFSGNIEGSDPYYRNPGFNGLGSGIATLHWPTPLDPPLMNGHAMTDGGRVLAAVGDVALSSSSPRFGALRVYNRQLNAAEIEQNWRRDAERFEY